MARISKVQTPADAVTKMVEVSHKRDLKLRLIAAVIASRWEDAQEYLDLLTPAPAAPVEATPENPVL